MSFAIDHHSRLHHTLGINEVLKAKSLASPGVSLPTSGTECFVEPSMVEHASLNGALIFFPMGAGPRETTTKKAFLGGLKVKSCSSSPDSIERENGGRQVEKASNCSLAAHFDALRAFCAS